MLTIPGWGLWMMAAASFLGGFLLLAQLRAAGWRLR
jgi:hypothetical protein